MSIEAMKQALEALDLSHPRFGIGTAKHISATAALRQAIAEAEGQEKALQALHNENERLGLYKDAYAEQEPVAWIERDMQCDDFDPDSVTCEKPTIAANGWEWVALYTHPPKGNT